MPRDYVLEDDEETLKAFRRNEVQNSISKHDIAFGTRSLAVQSVLLALIRFRR